MKRLSLLLFLAALVGQVSLYAQTQEETQPQNKNVLMANGRMWNEWSDEMKMAFVIGFSDGTTLMRLASGSYKFGAFVGIPGLKNSEIVRSLDDFYKDPTNSLIAVGGAWQWVAKKVKGATAAELDEFAARLRKGVSGERSNQPSTP